MAVTLLGYQRREVGFLGIAEVHEQYLEYCAFNGIEVPKDDDLDDDFDDDGEEEVN